MKTLQGIVLGNAAADTFLLLDDESVGRLVRALVYYSFHGERPAVPKPLRAVFYAIYRESCRARRKNAVPPTEIPFADTPEDAQAQKSAKVQDCANGAIRVEENRIEENRPSANAEVERDKPRAPACEDFPDCPIPADRLRVLAAHIGIGEAELSAWRDFYTAQEWRFKPVSPRPMTQAAAEASLRNWHNLGGIRAAKQAHIDAKMDARAAARDPSRFAPPPEKGGIDTAALGI